MSSCERCRGLRREDLCAMLGDLEVFASSVEMNLFPESEPRYKCPETVEGKLFKIVDAYKLLQQAQLEGLLWDATLRKRRPLMRMYRWLRVKYRKRTRPLCLLCGAPKALWEKPCQSCARRMFQEYLDSPAGQEWQRGNK